MKQRYCKKQPKDVNHVEYYLSEGLPLALAEALSARGISPEDWRYFQGDDCFHSPFEMKNMQEAAETISYVLEEGGSVLIYGDYDADGLTAASILSLFFFDNGVDNDVIIPTREMGYGLHADAVIEAFDKKFYDLVITVDCGIANKAEVEKILEELGTEIIVTDHHELQEFLPPCLCVNPKMGYPFADLSGAGVAWKLVEALAGREVAANYSNLAMIGTVADSMPMSDENRSIVKLGLANKNHRSLQKLAELSRCSEQLSVTDVTMRIAPKINAAGRMANPNVALKVLLARDRVSPDVEKLIELNEQRKNAEITLMEQADKMCVAEQIRQDKLVFLYGENWQRGILGIVAARYKEKYGVTAAVLAKDDEKGVYVGSARGADGIDLFEKFSLCKDLLAQFGGHKAAVGFSVSPQNLLPLKNRLASVLSCENSVSPEKTLFYDIDLDDGGNLADMYAFVQQLEPTLTQNKVLFHLKDVAKTANTFGKDDPKSLSVTLSSGVELKSFRKRAEYLSLLREGADFEALISLDYDDYNKRVCGVVEDMRLCNSVCFDEFYRINLIKNFVPLEANSLSEEQVVAALAENSVLAIFDDYETYLSQCQRFDFSDFYEDIFFDNSFSAKTVAISPTADYGFSKYNKVVYFCKQRFLRVLPQNAQYFCVEPANPHLYEAPLNRDLCVAVYSQLRHKSPFESVRGVYDKYLQGKMEYCQYLAALRVFEELKFIKIEDKYTVKILPSPKVELTESAIFGCFAERNEKD